MSTGRHMHLAPRRRRLGQDVSGYTTWQTIAEPRTLSSDQAALVLCDVWDRHWCRAADERLAALLAPMNRLAGAWREPGLRTAHAPSNTMTSSTATPPPSAPWTYPRWSRPRSPM